MDLPYELSTDRAPQIGLVVLQSDETIELDMRRLLPETAELMVSRVPSGTHVTLDSLGEMEAGLCQSASLFPRSAKFAVVGYGCTSGTAQIGAANVAKTIRAGTTTQATTEPVSALIAACRHLGVTRLGLLSPYIASVSDRLREVLGEAGITVPAFASFNESEEAKVVRIAPGSILTAARAMIAQSEIDALFVSCTNLRALDVIAPFEAETSVPLLTSNQVLAWDLLRLAKLDAAPEGAGMLWRA